MASSGACPGPATGLQDVKVDVADGMVRFGLGDRFWDVAVDGLATKVRRRRGRLEVTVEKPVGSTSK